MSLSIEIKEKIIRTICGTIEEETETLLAVDPETEKFYLTNSSLIEISEDEFDEYLQELSRDIMTLVEEIKHKLINNLK